ncbi:MAG: TerC family protein [Bacteriovoracaceae bacterium]|nr:TerC family protein [Bacteriovoracaceae bacterium]
MESLFTFQALVSFLTLCALEIVLGIDNIIFISIVSSKLDAHEQAKARTVGLSLAVVTRVILLLSISWVISLTAPLFTIFSQEISGRDLILLLGGLFLIAKSTHEIHSKLESAEEVNSAKASKKFSGVILQILLLDAVFSLDSVITAVGMTNQIVIMISAVVVSTLVMIFTSSSISRFVDRHPTVKILALSFLLLIGVTLVAEGSGQHFPKGYIYFSMAFSLFVESLNIRLRKKVNPVHLKKTI